MISHQLQNSPEPKKVEAKSTNEEKAISRKDLKEVSEKKAEEVWSCADVSNDLQPAFEAAKNISYYKTKDETMLTIARKALCIGNFELYEKAANEISYYTTKDQAYADGVDFTLQSRNFDLSKKYAGQISYYSTQDAARKRIVLKASQK